MQHPFSVRQRVEVYSIAVSNASAAALPGISQTGVTKFPQMSQTVTSITDSISRLSPSLHIRVFAPGDKTDLTENNGLVGFVSSK
jgi:hypothetical protein